MKPFRPMLAALGLVALAACESADQTSTLTAPVALASPTAVSQTICSNPTSTQLSFDGSTWIPAFHTEPQGPYGATIGTSTWVGPSYNSGVLSAPPGTYFFRTQFSLPADAKTVRLTGALHADNQAIVRLNGTQVFAHPLVLLYGNFQSPEDAFDASTPFVVGGVNTVAFDLVNGGEEASAAALDFCYTVEYNSVSESESESESDGGGGGGGETYDKSCPAAPAVAAHILHGMGVKPNSALYKNIIAQVGIHMTQGAQFDGFDKCDPRYRAAVAAFVALLVPGSE